MLFSQEKRFFDLAESFCSVTPEMFLQQMFLRCAGGSGEVFLLRSHSCFSFQGHFEGGTRFKSPSSMEEAT